MFINDSVDYYVTNFFKFKITCKLLQFQMNTFWWIITDARTQIKAFLQWVKVAGKVWSNEVRSVLF